MKKPTESKPRALITGASSGIGLALAEVFAAHGHDLIITARRAEALEALAGRLEGAHGVKVAVFPGDLRDPAFPALLFERLRAENLEVDVLVNNAGFGVGGPFTETDIGRELDIIKVNVAALVELTKLFLAPMVAKRRGRIMNVASTAAFQPGPLMSIYYASKAFVLSFSQAIAEELRNTGVTVTAFCPGPTRTEFAEVAGIGKSRLFNAARVATAEEVAVFAYKATMKGKRVAIPGVQNVILAQGNRLAPRRLATALVRKIQENR